MSDQDQIMPSELMTKKSTWVSWPANEARRRLMGSNFPCDMWTGPCSCGAVHEEGR